MRCIPGNRSGTWPWDCFNFYFPFLLLQTEHAGSSSRFHVLQPKGVVVTTVCECGAMCALLLLCVLGGVWKYSCILFHVPEDLISLQLFMIFMI